MSSSQRTGSGLLLCGLTLGSPTIMAAQNWSCPADTNTAQKTTAVGESRLAHALQPTDVQAEAVYIEANQAMFRERGQSLLEGDVIIRKDGTRLTADLATYEKQSQQVTAQGNVYMISSGLELRSEKLSFNLGTNTGDIEQADYRLNSADGRGSSQKLSREPEGITRLTDASYTTCPIGNNSWDIHAREIKLDRTQDQGVARNVSLRIGSTPVLYLPYFSFPLSDKRKSGLLIPSLGSDEKSGLRVSIPYYLNLAPNYDLTLTTHFLSQRGVKLESEFRYLSKKEQGRFHFDYIPGDNEYNDKHRYYFDFEYERRPGQDSELVLRAEGVSDDDYFNDLGTSLEASSVVKLERSLRYTKRRGDWSFSALVQDYQVIGNSTEPYARLPQLTLDWQPTTAPEATQWSFNSEYTFFANSKATDGHRLNTQAKVSKRFGNNFAYITPEAWLQHTHYQLDRANNKTINRTLSGASIDAGLFFERDRKGGEVVQTLEPRIFYTFTPFRDQNAIPVFDSSAKILSYSQLFDRNRFTGSDRVEDANRLSTSLTTRFQNRKTGREVFRASIGQIYHFNDRRVRLPDETLRNISRSELVFEAAGELNAATRLVTTAFFDTREKEVSSSQIKINYKDKKQRILNLGYNQRKGDYEAAHISFATPVTQKWKVAGGYEHDLKNDRMLESVLGLEYSNCCWKGRIAGRKYLLSDNTTYDDAIFIELELKGLGNFGSSASDFLGNRIYGYE